LTRHPKPVNLVFIVIQNDCSEKYLFLLVFFELFASFLLDGRSLENKNSIRFAETSRKILEFNDWIVQRLDGKIYPDKRLQPHTLENRRDARYRVGFFLGDLVIHSDF